MAAPRKSSTRADPFQVTLLIFVIIAALYFAGEVLKPLALSVLLSFALAPAARWLERWGLPRAPAVVLTGLAALGLIGGVGYVVGQQLTALAKGLPDYQENIEAKLRGVFQPGQQTAAGRLEAMASRVTAKLDNPPADEPMPTNPIQKVQVVEQPSFQERLRSAIGPYLESLGVGSFVLILVLFILIGREDLSDRIVGLFGHQQVSLTTRTMEEIGQRISRYLATFTLMNSGFGLVIGLGLGLIGVRYAVLWGVLAGLLRFIPYVGPAVAFLLPLVFSFAYFPGWAQPLEVVALFGVVETLLNSFLEPVIYGKTTGVSALGLLVAAMFWTWLWGTLGLLLSTPLTVCLAVLGKYVPRLRFFATLLGEEAELAPDVRFYQRLVALDRDAAVALVEEALKQRPRVEVFDRILVPALTRVERDAARDALGAQEQAFAQRVVGELVENLEGIEDTSLDARATGSDEVSGSADGGLGAARVAIVGVAACDTSDVLVLRMLAQLLAPLGLTLEIIADVESSLQLAELVAERVPTLIVLSSLPPKGLTRARYLARRLRARFETLPLMVGRWSQIGGPATAERLKGVGASYVVFTLAEARERILSQVLNRRKPEPAASPLPG